jgi:lysophospholipase L1-like esterase
MPNEGEIARGYQTIFSETVGLAGYNNQGKSGWPMAVVSDVGGVVNTILSISDYTNYDLCTIACGTNDFKLNVPLGQLGIIGDTAFDDTTFYGAYRKAIEYILTNSPTIRLVLMTPLQRDNDSYDVNTVNTAGHKLIDYVNAIKAIGEMYGLPVCDMYANSGFTKKTLATYTLDGLHPNTTGYVRMGNYLTGFLNAVGN